MAVGSIQFVFGYGCKQCFWWDPRGEGINGCEQILKSAREVGIVPQYINAVFLYLKETSSFTCPCGEVLRDLCMHLTAELAQQGKA